MDIDAAEDIFGSNLGALKGKTVTRKGKPVDGRIITGVPAAIKDRYKKVTLCMDIMFVNVCKQDSFLGDCLTRPTLRNC